MRHFRQCGQWSAGSWLHSYIPTSRSRPCGQSYGPGTKLLLWAIRDSFFTLNSTYLMHGLRNHWVSFPYYCVQMNSWNWTSTGWPFKVHEDASHIWQATVDHWLVDTGLDMSSRWRAGAGSGCVNNVSMVCITGEGFRRGRRRFITVYHRENSETREELHL